MGKEASIRARRESAELPHQARSSIESFSPMRNDVQLHTQLNYKSLSSREISMTMASRPQQNHSSHISIKMFSGGGVTWRSCDEINTSFLLFTQSFCLVYYNRRGTTCYTLLYDSWIYYTSFFTYFVFSVIMLVHLCAVALALDYLIISTCFRARYKQRSNVARLC